MSNLDIINMDWFYGRAATLAPGAIVNKANSLNIDPNKFMAMSLKESARGPFLPDGRPTILFEAHIFARETKNKYNQSHPNISSKSWNRNLYGAGGAHQYTRLQAALELDPEAALKSCSWGSYQIMGFNHKDAGYDTVKDMVSAFCDSAQSQLDSFANLLVEWGLVTALQSWDTDTIGYRYNGPRYRENQYAEKLDEIYRSLSADTILKLGSYGHKVRALQMALRQHKFNVTVDGSFGPATERAVMLFQEKNGLTIDGTVGPQTWSDFALKRTETTTVAGSKRVKGAVVTATAGAGISFDSISELLTKAQQLNTQGTQEAIDLLQSQQDNHILMTAVGIGLILVAGYFIWTKYVDNKKQEGVL